MFLRSSRKTEILDRDDLNHSDTNSSLFGPHNGSILGKSFQEPSKKSKKSKLKPAAELKNNTQALLQRISKSQGLQEIEIDRISIISQTKLVEESSLFEREEKMDNVSIVVLLSKEEKIQKALKIYKIVDELFQQKGEEMIESLSTIYQLSDDKPREIPEKIKSQISSKKEPNINLILIVSEAIKYFIINIDTVIQDPINYYEGLNILKYYNQWEIVKAVCKKFTCNFDPSGKIDLSLNATKIIYENYLLAELKTEHSDHYLYSDIIEQKNPDLIRLNLNHYFNPKNKFMGEDGSKQQYYEILVLHNCKINYQHEPNTSLNWNYIDHSKLDLSEIGINKILQFKKFVSSSPRFVYESHKMVEQLDRIAISFVPNKIKPTKFSKTISQEINKILVTPNINNQDSYETIARLLYIKLNDYKESKNKPSELSEIEESLKKLNNYQTAVKLNYYYPEGPHKPLDCLASIWDSKELSKSQSATFSQNQYDQYYNEYKEEYKEEEYSAIGSLKILGLEYQSHSSFTDTYD